MKQEGYEHRKEIMQRYIKEYSNPCISSICRNALWYYLTHHDEYGRQCEPCHSVTKDWRKP